MDVIIGSQEAMKWSGVKTSSATPETQLDFDFGTDSGGSAGSVVGRRVVVGFGASTLARVAPKLSATPTLASTATLTGAGTDRPVLQLIAGKDVEFVLPYGVAEKYKGVSLKLSVASVVVSVAVFD